MLHPKESQDIPAIGKVVAEFHTPVCATCQAVGSQLAKVEPEYEDSDVCFCSVNAAEGDFIDEFDLVVAPTYIFFRDGEEVERVEGPTSLSVLRGGIERL